MTPLLFLLSLVVMGGCQREPKKFWVYMETPQNGEGIFMAKGDNILVMECRDKAHCKDIGRQIMETVK